MRTITVIPNKTFNDFTQLNRPYKLSAKRPIGESARWLFKAFKRSD
jgi:hypothetical protein